MTSEQCKAELVKRFTNSPSAWKRTKKNKGEMYIYRDFTNGELDKTVITDISDTTVVDIIDTCDESTGVPSDYYFQLNTEPEEEGPIFFITKRLYYDRYHGLDDRCGSHNTPMPPDFGCEIMEATWDYDGDPMIGRQSLLNAGFIEKKMF